MTGRWLGVGLGLTVVLAGCAGRPPAPWTVFDWAQYPYIPRSAGPAAPVRKETVVLLPNEDGRSTAVIVSLRDGKSSVRLDKPYAAAEVASGALVKGETNAEGIRTQYNQLLAVQPPAVRSFILYFEFDRAVLTEESHNEVDRILTEAAMVPAAEIEVIGHTDARGTPQYNLNLGRTRATYVAGLMEARGFARDRLNVQSRGESEPLVPAPDGADEPRNRRVEIRLR